MRGGGAYGFRRPGFGFLAMGLFGGFGGGQERESEGIGDGAFGSVGGGIEDPEVCLVGVTDGHEGATAAVEVEGLSAAEAEHFGGELVVG